MNRRLRLCSHGELFYVVVQICNNFLGVDEKEFWRVFASSCDSAFSYVPA